MMLLSIILRNKKERKNEIKKKMYKLIEVRNINELYLINLIARDTTKHKDKYSPNNRFPMYMPKSVYHRNKLDCRKIIDRVEFPKDHRTINQSFVCFKRE